MKGKILFILSSLSYIAATAQVQVKNLRCERLDNPLGIDVTAPRLSWQLTSPQRNVQQTAYEIIVASTREKLAKNEGDLWQSGKVNDDHSVQIAYAGKALGSRTECYWKVRSYTSKGTSEWSAPAHWSMGLLLQTDWKARWIGIDAPFAWDSVTQWSRLSARYLAKTITHAAKVKQATVYVCGLGMYELYINGNKVGDQVLAPAPTDYRKTILYNTYDVTNALQHQQENISVVLGNGRYFTMRQNYKPKKINNFGFPKMLFQLEITYTDGKKETIVSDDSWKLTGDGPIRSNNEYDGEIYDATKELTGARASGSAGKWQAAQLVTAPEGATLVAQMNEPMRILKRVQPVSIKKISGGRYILDLGQNLAGWLQMKVQGKRGDSVTLRFAESLKPDGELYTANLRDARATNTYILKGGGMETWHPAFVYQGFRYVEISGYPGVPVAANFEGQLIADDLATTGKLETSDTIINKIYRNAWWGIASDYKGMPVDCPQRNERQPWLGDRAAGAYGESFVFDNSTLYAKWLDDIEDAQTEEGAIPDVAPAFWNYYSDNVTWPATYFFVADMLYRQFGDKAPILKHYASMKKWMGYMEKNYLKGDLMTKDKYGDWCVPPESLELIRSKDSLRNTDGVLIATASYYRLLQCMQTFARLAGKEEDVNGYAALAAKMKTAFNNKFFNAAKNCYDNNTVTANLLPLYFDMVPDEARDAVINSMCTKIKVDNNMHISTGVIGTQYLMRGLSRFGHTDIALALATNNTYPSWGYMTEQGATTIWELWNGNTANPQMNSQNHVMLLGDLIIWLYENVAGIQADGAEVAYKKIIMKPVALNGLKYTNATYQTPYGAVTSNWKKQNNTFTWNITVPANAKALVYLPTATVSQITESGKPLTAVEGLRILEKKNGQAICEVGSGAYAFTVNQ